LVIESGDPQVCGESDGGWECAEHQTYDEARGTCAMVGARLCTATELELGEATGTGCGHDARQVWSHSGGLGGVTCGAAEKATVLGRIIAEAGAGAATTADVVCIPKGKYAAVRCCANATCAHPGAGVLVTPTVPVWAVLKDADRRRADPTAPSSEPSPYPP
jgi:hypothetical protein